MIKPALLAVLLPLVASSMTIASMPEAFVYKEVDGQSLQLHVFLPEGATSPAPAIVWYYGSGFRQKEPGQFFEHGKILAKMGMASISTNIRGARMEGERRDYTICIEDAKSAFRWVRSNVERLNLDPDRIAVGGGSSGGFLAAAIATLPGFDDPSDNQSVPLKPSMQILFNPFLGHDESPTELAPLQHIDAGIPPAIMFWGTADAGLYTAYDYQLAMDRVGSYCEIMTYRDQTHGFFNYREGTNPYYYKTVGDMLVFLEKRGYVKR